MKNQIKNGLFWGIGVGTGISLIVLAWIIGINIYENSKVERNLVDYANHELKIANSDVRVVGEGVSTYLLITGSVSGYDELLQTHEGAEALVSAKIYNSESVFLAHCGKNAYSYEMFLMKDSYFSLKCENIPSKDVVGKIEYEIDVKVLSEDV